MWNEEDEGEDGESEKRVARNFADDVSVQDAHGARAKCSTALEGRRCREME